ncbi:proline dehydrogenase family protein [Hazenella sp. IB182357]|uniref:proline dehydrogenase n=1 Tax=Polycladospora coralii TaxID=2771432 RepID=A0A926RVT3_9BACL|nr:proline dehydrogenase family protein [Polycladospora coralii]MBD1370756.1 proline dehydrogenase family protein [Polycladospora coralii]MBS7529694.1 proline dehydrogenase family protein [Polycladospora coralii]
MSLSRKLVLTVAGNRLITSLVSKYGMKLGASRFVAGETLGTALEGIKKINDQGLMVTLDHLGESVYKKKEATAATEAALKLFDAIHERKINSNVSVKLTQLGLDIDPTFCYENINRIVAKAKEYNNFVRIDMEDTPRLEITLDILNRLLDQHGHEHVGTVIQSYLYRSANDCKELAKRDVNLRIVKGAYKEPTEVAFPDKKDVDQNYIKLVQQHLSGGHYTAIATHDEALINDLKSWFDTQKIDKARYEFQMLYGVRSKLQKQLVEEGYRVRVYVPYGKDWYPYFTRRIAERPANALFVLKSFFQK